MLAAVGVVSAHNAPLWLRCYSPDEEPHRLHSVLHCALDSVDERLAAGTKAREAHFRRARRVVSPSHSCLPTRRRPRTWAC